MPSTTSPTDLEAPPADDPRPPSPPPPPPPSSRRLLWAVLAVLLLPLVVSAAVLVLDVGAAYRPASDHALIELQVRDVGREPVLKGLYSRADWSHPGPAQFLVLAPFHRLAGGASIGACLGALAVNGASVAGMVAVARRRGGTPLLLVSALGLALLLRTLGADFVRDPWNCFVTVLPFALVVFLTWALAAGDTWALPVAVGVASFVAQAHVGYVALAVPLLGLGVAARCWQVARGGDRVDRRRLLRALAVGAAVGGVLWLPVVVDLLTGSPSNLANVVDWFLHGEEEPHTLADGWNVLAAQFATLPEWLTWHREPTWWSGEPQALHTPPVPWLLAVVAIGGALLWRRRPEGRALVAVSAAAFALGLLAVARTVGLAFDYRLRWTWVLGLLGFVVVAWAVSTWASSRWHGAGRVLGAAAMAATVVACGFTAADALGAGVPYAGDSEAMAALTPGVLEAVEGVEGQVLVTDDLASSWYARGVVLALERHGLDARVPAERAELFGDHRVVDAAVPAARLHVTIDDRIAAADGDDGLRPVARWRSVPPAAVDDARRRVAALDAELAAGALDADRHARAVFEVNDALYERSDAYAYAVAVHLDTDPAR